MTKLERKEFIEIDSIEDIKDNYFYNNQSIERIRFNGIKFDSLKFVGSLIKGSEFLNCSFLDCIFDHMDLQRVWFKKCNIHKCLFSPEFRFITGKFENCTIIDSNFPEAFIQNVKWIDCEISQTDFCDLKAKSIAFKKTSLEKVNLDGAVITRGDFRSVPNLQRKTFYNVKVDDCEFNWNEIFVIMQFEDPQTENLYNYGIVPVIKELGIDCKRVDRYEFKGRITDEILQNIVTTKCIVAECSAPNKNVFFEIGYALGRNKDVIFCVDKEKNIPFDLKDYKFIIHNNSIDELKKQLRDRVIFLLRLNTDTAS